MVIDFIIVAFSHSCREEQNLNWHVGLHTHILMTRWRWHLGFEACRSWNTF
jgi:hypothetical protein